MVRWRTPGIGNWLSVRGSALGSLVGDWRQLLRVGILVSVVLSICTCEGPKRTPIRYLIPEGYVGWIEIDYEVATGVPPGREGKFEVFRIPANGHLDTSARYEEGWASDEHYYYSARGERRRLPQTISGRGGMVWGGHNGQSGGGPEYMREFIGTEAQCWSTASDPRFWPPS
jgi:Family of unknown function (DUF6843)